MYRHLSTTHIGIVHEVVVKKGVVMIGLQANGRHQDVLWLLTPQVVTKECQHRTDALATYCQHILYRLIERSGFAVVGQTNQKVVDLFQDFVR